MQQTTPSIIALIATMASMEAAVVISDDFDDSTVTGWNENVFGATGSVSESGSSITLTSTRGTGGSGPMVISSQDLINTTGSVATTITVSDVVLSGTDPDGRFIVGVLDEGFAGFLILNARVNGPNLDLQIEGGTPGGGPERKITLSSIPYVLGNPINFSLTFDADSVSATAGAFSSSDFPYATSFTDDTDTVVPGFNPLALLGGDASVALVSSTETDNSNFVGEVGSVSVDGALAPVPEPATSLLGGLAALALLRRRR